MLNLSNDWQQGTHEKRGASNATLRMDNALYINCSDAFVKQLSGICKTEPMLATQEKRT